MATNTNLITSNSADILLNLITIAKKYNLDSMSDTFLRTGNFGYITELSAKIIQNSVISKQIDYNELFASTAINPMSLLELCHSFNIDVATASPAYATLELTINLDDAQMYNLENNAVVLNKYGNEITSINSNRAIIIDRDTKFMAGNTNFYLEKSIIVWIDPISKRWQAKYLLTEENRTSFQYLDNTHIDIRVRTSGTTRYLTLYPRVYQFETETMSKLIHKSEIIYTSLINFSYNDNYVGSRLFYTLNNNLTKRQEISLSTNVITKDPHVKAFGGDLKITFPNDLDSFKPSTNSIFQLETYVSKGDRGNIVYNRPLNIVQSEKTSNKYQLVAYLKDGMSYGGVDEPGTEELRRTFINEVSTRNIISTSSDLNSYFVKLKNLIGTIGNSDVKFIKRRDDILKRYFDSYILFRDNRNYTIDINKGGSASEYDRNVSNSYLSSVVPTYTFNNVKFNEGFSGKSIKFGQKILTPNKNNNSAVFVNDYDGDDYYFVPFYIHVTTTPINSVHYIYNRTNQTSQLKFEKNNDTEGVWINPMEVNLSRTSYDQDYYNLTFLVETSEYIDDGAYKYTISLFQEGNSLLKTISYDDDDNDVIITNIDSDDPDTGEKINYTTLTFKMYVNTDDEFSFDDRVSLRLRDNEQVFTDLKFKLKIEKDNNPAESVEFSSDYMSLFIDLQDIMYSDIRIESNNNIIDYISIYDVPAIHGSYLKDGDGTDDDLSYFTSQMFIFIDLLREAQNRIDQTELMNVKFFRTYGASEIYSSTKMNLNLRLDINTKLTSASEAKALIDAIRIFVDTYNGNKIFRYTDLVTNVMNSELGSYIYDISFRGLNGTWEQTVELINYDKVYYPEHFNISKEDLNNIKVYNYNPITGEKELLLG